MFEFLAADGNRPFSVALCMMLIIATLEGVTTLLGAGISSMLESFVPDLDLDIDLDADMDGDLDSDLDAHAASHGPLTAVLGWLRIGEVPVLVLFVIFLTSFGLIGLGLQTLMSGLTGRLVPASIAWLPVFAVSLPVLRTAAGLAARVMPKDETLAVSRETFVGRVAVIVLGTARRSEPAQARLRDEHGKTHYIMAEPDVDGEEFSAGDDVLIVRSAGARFRVIRPPSDVLLAQQRVAED